VVCTGDFLRLGFDLALTEEAAAVGANQPGDPRTAAAPAPAFAHGCSGTRAQDSSAPPGGDEDAGTSLAGRSVRVSDPAAGRAFGGRLAQPGRWVGPDAEPAKDPGGALPARPRMQQAVERRLAGNPDECRRESRQAMRLQVRQRQRRCAN